MGSKSICWWVARGSFRFCIKCLQKCVNNCWRLSASVWTVSTLASKHVSKSEQLFRKLNCLKVRTLETHVMSYVSFWNLDTLFVENQLSNIWKSLQTIHAVKKTFAIKQIHQICCNISTKPSANESCSFSFNTCWNTRSRIASTFCSNWEHFDENSNILLARRDGLGLGSLLNEHTPYSLDPRLHQCGS